MSSSGGGRLTDTTGEGGGGGIVALPSSLLGPLKQLAALAQEYGSVPAAIFALISAYILNGIFNVIGVVAGSVLFVFDLFVTALDGLQALLVGAFGSAGLDVLGALVSIQQSLASVIAVAGPAAPLVAGAALAVTAFALYRVSIALATALNLDAVLDLFGIS